jgi:hypothetical protein
MPLVPLDPAVPALAIPAALAAGFPLAEQEAAWSVDTDDPVLCMAALVFMLGFDAAPEQRADAIARTKAEGDRRMAMLASPSRQLELIARGVELQDKKQSGGTWTAEEAADAEVSRAAQRAARRIRRAQREIVADLATWTDPGALVAYDPAADPRWSSVLAALNLPGPA